MRDERVSGAEQAKRRPRRGLIGPNGAIGRLARDRTGVAALEFALIAPFLLILYMAGSEVTIAVTLNRKVQHTAATINDLITQSSDLKASGVDGILNIAAAIVEPYDSTKLRIRVTQVKIEADGKQIVDWSRAKGETAAAKGAPFALPPEFANDRNKYVVVSETYYDYIPMGGYGLTNPMAMGEKAFLNPRIGDRVFCDDC